MSPTQNPFGGHANSRRVDSVGYAHVQPICNLRIMRRAAEKFKSHEKIMARANKIIIVKLMR